ncbi:MAG: pilus assembly PilX N-terminal domain-containing protein, partial [Syntrophales bacterium]
MAQLIEPRKEVRHSDERGMVLVVVLLLTAVLVLLGSTAVIMSTTDMKISANYKAGTQAFYEAEAGVEQVMYYLRNNTVAYPTAGSPTTVTVTCPAGFSFNPLVTLHYVAPYRYRFQMTGIGTHNT